MQVKSLLLAIFWLAFSIPSFARDKLVSPVSKTRALQFVKNEGQLTDQNGKPRPELHTRLKTGRSLNVFTGAGLLTYQWQQKGEMYRVEANLIGANINVQPLYELPLSYTEHYFGSGKDIKAQSYGRVVYPGVYPNIDWVLYVNDDAHLKYDFIVHPGGNPSDIRIRYSGATAISLQKDGSLSVTTPMGVLGEQAPISYTREGKSVGSRFILSDSIVSFAVAPYIGTLIIDPEIAWGTYFGGLQLDIAYGTATDSYGNVYVAGVTGSLDNIATTGAYQQSYGGSPSAGLAGDAFLVKYNAAGEKLWSTYYGGSLEDRGSDVCIDPLTQEVYLAGSTRSTSGIATVGSHQPIHGGNYDAFLCKFDTSGQRIWATYYGGSSIEGSAHFTLGVACDNQGNVYLTGDCTSTTGIASTGSYQQTRNGARDAFLAKFDALGQRQWGTYFGGNANDFGKKISCDELGYVYLTGYTNSTAGLATVAAAQPNLSGDNDGFVARFNSSGILDWATYLGGPLADQANHIAATPSGRVYVVGVTSSTSDISSLGAHQTMHGGGNNDGFLTAYEPNGTLAWSTYYGGDGMDAINAVGIAGNGDILLAGVTYSDTGIATPGAFQTALSSSAGEAFIAKFNVNGVRDWGTYWGGADNENPNSLSVYGHHVIVAGSTNSALGISTAGSAQPNFGGGNYDAFLVAINFCEQPARPLTIVGDTVLCAGATTQYYATPADTSLSYLWSMPQAWSGSSDTAGINLTINNDGWLVVRTQSACATSDSLALWIAVNPLPLPLVVNNNGILSTTQTFTSYQWYHNDVMISGATMAFHAAQMQGLYKVLVSDSNGCTAFSEALAVDITALDDTQSLLGNIQVYPNPFYDQIQISSAIDLNFQIIGVDGKVMLKGKTGGVIHVGSLPAGIYALRLYNLQGNYIGTKKMVKN